MVYRSSDSQYREADYTNRCGQAKRYCLAAVSDGSNYKPGQGGAEKENGGTSGAAPAVSGGLAVIKEAFPSKDRRWSRRRILATASHTTADGKQLRDKNGNVVNPDAEGYSDIFGRGIMRLDLATQPLGDSRLSVRGDRLGVSQKYSVKQSFVRSSAVFGDGLKLGLSQVNTYKFDIMGAEFTYNMGDNVGIQPPMRTTQFFNFTGNTDTPPQTYTSKAGQLSFMDTTPQKFSNLDYTQHTMPFAPPITNPKQPPLQVSYTVDNTISIQTRITTDTTNTLTTQLTYTQPKTKTIFSTGIHTEQGTLLGAKFAGAYGGLGRANTAYIQATKNNTLGNWSMRYNATLTTTSTNGFNTRTLENINNLIASEFSVIAKRAYKKGTLGVAVYQPLRLEQGTMDVKFVNKVTDNTRLSYDTNTVPITPSARQVTLEAYYDFANSPFAIKTKVTRHNGHVRGNHDNTILLRYYKPFSLRFFNKF